MRPASWVFLGWVFLTLGCGRITPSVQAFGVRSSGSSTPSSSTPSSTGGGYKPVYDDKGCVNATGESGSRQQAACRSGK